VIEYDDYNSLSRKELQEMYEIVINTIPESKKKYELLQEIIQCYIHRTNLRDQTLISLSKEMKTLITKHELNESELCRMKQIQLIMRDLNMPHT
jgi:hypothetical protein